MSLKLKDVGLMAAAPVKALIDREPDVQREIAKFVLGELGTDKLNVMGPADPEDMAYFRQDPNRRPKPIFPVVTLNLSIVKHHLTGRVHVKVTASDEHMHELAVWMLRFRQPNLIGTA